MPRVLLIGDSITRGYFGEVEKHLAGKAYCARLTTSKCMSDPSFIEELWQNVPPREQVRLTSLLIDRVEFDGVGGNIGITFHDTGMKSLATGEMEVTA